MPRPLVDACVTSSNNAAALPAVFASLRTEGERIGKVFLIDSGSQDGGPESIAAREEAVELHRLEGNRGPCAARNLALRLSRAPWLLLLDGDCSLAPGCLSALTEELELAAAEVAVLSPRVVYAAEPDWICFDGGQAHFLGLLCLENARTPLSLAVEPKREPGAVSSAALLLRRETALEAGGFEEGYRFFGEDLEFSLRLRALGHRLRHVPRAVVFHHKPRGEAPPSAWPSGDYHRRRAELQNANRWRTLLTYCDPKTLQATAILQLAYEALCLAQSARAGELRAHLRGLASLVAQRRAILDRRRRLWRRRRVPDATLFSSPRLSWRSSVCRLPLAGPLQRTLEAASALLWRWRAPEGARVPTRISAHA